MSLINESGGMESWDDEARAEAREDVREIILACASVAAVGFSMVLVVILATTA